MSLDFAVVLGPLLEVRSLRHDGDELLVDAATLPSSSKVHGRAAAIPFLHPWANRLAGDTYAVGETAVALAAGDPALGRDGNGLPLHGTLAPAGAWRWEEEGAVARLDHPGEDGSAFPFPHTIRVTFAAGGDRLEITTALVATGAVAVPVSFGWHPYFTLPGTPRADWIVALPERRHVAFDARGIPTGEGTVQAAEAPLAARAFDDGFDGLAPGATLAVADARRRVSVTLLDGYPVGQIFAPPEHPIVCLEPMTAPVDALRTGDGLRLVAPGATFTARFAISVD
jgi:galactose mutarotase-like enzyme